MISHPHSTQAMDNFDRNESTLTGTGSTHDTILVLFQNVPTDKEKPADGNDISTRPFSDNSRTTVKLRSKVLCQQLVRMGQMKERREIDESFEALESVFNLYPTFTERLDPTTAESSVTDATPTTESTSNDPENATDEIADPDLNLIGTSTVTTTSTDSSSSVSFSSITLCKQ
jgi:hypothetical protein